VGFLNSIYLFGLLSAVIPFLIYLWFRRRAKVIDFSTLRFILEAHRRSVRRIQLRQLIVLILRALILALIAAAIARPILSGALPGLKAQAPTACVIILDNSYSMGYEGIRGRWFDLAKKKALEVLNSLKRGDSASLILASDHPDIRFSSLIQNLDEIRLEIQNATLSYRSTDILRSIEVANELLERSGEENGEIYLITDMRRNGWQNLGGSRLKLKAHLFILPVGEESPDNIAITSVKFNRSILPVNIPVKMDVRVRNFSDAPIKDAVLELSVDGEKRRQMTISIPPGDEVRKEITYIFRTPGYHFGWIQISGDRLAADNRRFFSRYVSGGVKALCISDRTSYLTYALNPSLGLIYEESPAIIPTSLTTERFEREINDIPLESYDLLVLGAGFSMSQTVAARVVDYVENGGKLLVFLGGEDKIPDLKGLEPILPALPVQIREADPPLKLGSFDRRHPALEPFNQEMISGPLSPDFFNIYALKVKDKPENLMRFSDGTPVILDRKTGLGEVVLLNVSSWNLNWTNFPLKPIFLPLVQQIVLYLASPLQETEVGVGDRTVLDVGEIRSVKVSLISEGEFPQISLPVNESGKVEFAGTSMPGIYRIDPSSKGGRTIYLSVNVPIDESDLSEIDPEVISKAFGGNSVLIDSVSDIERQIHRMRRGTEIWGWLLAMALGLMAVETVLSNLGAGVK